jgi:ABC-2 type transport system permease protein
MRAVIRVELVKLALQWRVRGALLLVLLSPPVVALVLRVQSGLPTDTLYGRWVQDIGLAFPLVLLGSAGVWILPALAALVAGDIFATEDGHGTWPLLLTRSVSPWQVLAAKALVAAVTTAVLSAALAVSAVLSGILLVGGADLVGLSGQSISFWPGVLLVLVAWASTLPTSLAVGAAALLVSAVSRNSVVGVAVPSVAALALTLISQLASLGGIRPLLLLPGLQAWHGLLLEDAQVAPVVIAAVVAVGWAAALMAVTVLVLRRQVWARS